MQDQTLRKFLRMRRPNSAVIEICLRMIRPKWFVILGFIHELVEKLVRGYHSTEYPRRFARRDLV